MTIESQVKVLPEVVRTPFEEAVNDVELEGWEDAWFSSGTFDSERYGPLPQPKIDFVYNWVNGSETGFREIKQEYELTSPLNDPSGRWISEHSINRYRDWDELKYSFRSLDQPAKGFINKIQLLVNSVQNKSDTESDSYRPQHPNWLKEDAETRKQVQILSQEDLFGEVERQCLPTFNSVSIESQIHNTPSDTDQLVALSDDMFLGAPHSASDFYSPLFGCVMGFKTDHYKVKYIRKADIPTFGEKPYLYYTSWLLNHRFGERDRKAQAHFTHSISRRVMKEAMASFPSPSHSWGMRAVSRRKSTSDLSLGDVNGDGYLDWSERQIVLEAIKPGRHAVRGGDSSTSARTAMQRERMYCQLPQVLKQAGLESPKSNINILWTSLDGPETIRNVKCNNFHIDTCFAESFDSPISDASYPNPDFSTSNIFSQLSRREPKCGDCLIKFLLSNTSSGLEPLLPEKEKATERETVVKALVKYQHTIVEPDAKFVMVKDAEQAREEILERMIKRGRTVGQWCLNDDVMTEDEEAVAQVNNVMQTVFETLFPEMGIWEK